MMIFNKAAGNPGDKNRHGDGVYGDGCMVME